MLCSRRSFGLVAGLALAAGLAVPSLTASAQVGTAITYQGLLERNEQKVNTATDMRFTLFNAATGGSVVGNQVTLDAQQVSNGLFSVALDFGVNPYTADAGRWMQIEVRNPAGSGTFSPMGARQKLTPSPFSLATRGINVNAAGEVAIGSATSAGLLRFARGGDGSTGAGFLGWSTPTNDTTLRLTNASGGGILDLASNTATTFSRTGDGLELLRINNAGNVGIARNNPTHRLDVLGNGPSVGGTSAARAIRAQSYQLWGSAIGIDATNLAGGKMWDFFATGGTAGEGQGKLILRNDTDGVNGLTVTGDGNVGIGTTSPGAKLEVNGNLRVSGSSAVEFGDPALETDPVYMYRGFSGTNQSVLVAVVGDDPVAGSTGDSFWIATRNADGSMNPRFAFDSGGSAFKPGGGSWGSLSDARAKHDIQPLGPMLDKVLKLQGKTFYYNDPKSKGAIDGQCTGFIAQEVETVFPEWVNQMADGYKTVSIRGFEALTVESLRELRAEKDAQIAERDAKIADLAARLERLEALLGQSAK